MRPAQHATGKHHPHHAGHEHNPPAVVTSFIALHLADAQQVSQATGVPVSVILAQSGLESGWGTRVVGYAYFGVKGHAPDGSSTKFVTHEVVHGKSTVLKATFRDYTSYSEAALDYAQMLRRVFPQAFLEKDSIKFVAHLHRYATDGRYVPKVQGIIRHNNLQQYDTKTP